MVPQKGDFSWPHSAWTKATVLSLRRAGVIYQRGWTPCHPRWLSQPSLHVKCLHCCSSFTTTLSPCSVVSMSASGPSPSPPSTAREQGWGSRNTQTYPHIQAQNPPNSFETAYRCLPWLFPKSTALGLSDLGQFNVAAFLKGITTRYKQEQLPWTSEEPLGQLVCFPFPSSETPRRGGRAGQRPEG